MAGSHTAVEELLFVAAGFDILGSADGEVTPNGTAADRPSGWGGVERTLIVEAGAEVLGRQLNLWADRHGFDAAEAGVGTVYVGTVQAGDEQQRGGFVARLEPMAAERCELRLSCQSASKTDRMCVEYVESMLRERWGVREICGTAGEGPFADTADEGGDPPEPISLRRGGQHFWPPIRSSVH